MTQPVFILGSGRNGTALLAQRLFPALSLDNSLEVHHQFKCADIARLGTLAYMGQEVTAQVGFHYRPAIEANGVGHWIDVSNKLSWLVPQLYALLPDAKFVLLVRDGRAVVSSYYHKLADNHYSRAGVTWLDMWRRGRTTEPPVEERFWWPLPDNHSDAWGRNHDRFYLCCWHWREVNRVASKAMVKLPMNQTALVRLEDLTNGGETMAGLLDWLGLRYNLDQAMAIVKRPHNVIEPQQHRLDTWQEAMFWKECGAGMTGFGYRVEDDYGVTY